MIIVTGAAGFIGSCLLSRLSGQHEVVAVDDFSNPVKNKNLDGKKIAECVDRDVFFEWLDTNYQKITMIFHLGARTDTTEFDYSIFEKLNVGYSRRVWESCCRYRIPLVYASSAATYGLGEYGYKDDENLIPRLKPLNPYGVSKNEFDKWALHQPVLPPFWAGLKFFNVYGPNEYHKARMASVIFHAYNQITATGAMKLFRSHNPDFADGGQLRDFIYVKDLVDVCLFLMENSSNPEKSGIYNLGTGRARTFLDLTRNVFRALNKEENISFVDTPADIRDKYQYFTEADMTKLHKAGYHQPFHSLEEGVEDYVKNYLEKKVYL